MTSRERVMAALSRQKPDRVPFVEVHVDRELGQALLGKKEFQPCELAEMLGLDALGFTWYPPLCAELTTSETGLDYVSSGLLRSRSDLSRIQLNDPRRSREREMAERFVEANRGDRALFCATNIGWDPLLLGMGHEAFAYALADDPGLVHEILLSYTEWAGNLVDEVQELGFDFIWFTDDIAFNSGPLVSPEVFRKHLLPPVRSVADRVHIPWVYHSDGNLLPIMDDLLSLGPSALHPIDPGAMDIRQVQDLYGERICLIGNIDLHYTLTRGTPEEVRREVYERIMTLGPRGGYIISSANSLTFYCPLENVQAMAQAIRDYGALPYKGQ